MSWLVCQVACFFRKSSLLNVRSSLVRFSLQTLLNSFRTFCILSLEAAKWPMRVFPAFYVVLTPAKKKSISSSMMNSSVNNSGV